MRLFKLYFPKFIVLLNRLSLLCILRHLKKVTISVYAALRRVAHLFEVCLT